MSPVALLIAPASKWQQTVPIREVLIQVINAGRQVRPAPFYTALSCSLSQMEVAYV